MGRRASLTIVVALLFGLPFACIAATLADTSAWSVWREHNRLRELLTQTLWLVGLTTLFAFPLGILGALLLERTALPGRHFLRRLVFLGLFVPLPLVISAWQAVFGSVLQPWNQGVWWAAFIHALTALPWVIALLGLGLARVEAELEEHALTDASPWTVWWRVTLPRTRYALGLALVWIILQTAGEIAVTDMANVRTFAEEVYTQYVLGGPEAQSRAVVVALPSTLLGIIGGLAIVRRWQNAVTVTRWHPTALVLPLGRWRWPLALGCWGLVLVLVGVPLVALVLQTGGHEGHGWRGTRFLLELRRAFQLQALMLTDSILWSGLAGLLAATLALLLCWAALDDAVVRRSLLLLVVLVWATPGPVLGFGLKEAITRLMDVEDVLLASTSLRPLRGLLYEWSTPLPVLWAHVLRLFPLAVAILWPAVQMIPRDLREMTRADGGSTWHEARHVIWPHARRAWLLAVVVVLALAMGELSTSKLVQVPGRQTFAQELFNQMHYGVTATTAALALVHLVVLVGGALIALWVSRKHAQAPH